MGTMPVTAMNSVTGTMVATATSSVMGTIRATVPALEQVSALGEKGSALERVLELGKKGLASVDWTAPDAEMAMARLVQVAEHWPGLVMGLVMGGGVETVTKSAPVLVPAIQLVVVTVTVLVLAPVPAAVMGSRAFDIAGAMKRCRNVFRSHLHAKCCVQ